jgi:predicted glycosyltransferase
MTDFVGWLPMPDGGAREQALTADYNAEMIEQIARFPVLRDRAVFVGNPDDVVPHGFGDGPRMIVVAGPRIDLGPLGSLAAVDGLEVRGYVHDLYRHLAACDLAVVQGGLTTTMELTACQRPFIYVPLRHHFEQNFHVRHRLDRYGAGRCLDYDQTAPEALAQAIAEEIGRPVSYRPVEADGAARAAALLAELI